MGRKGRIPDPREDVHALTRREVHDVLQLLPRLFYYDIAPDSNPAPNVLYALPLHNLTSSNLALITKLYTMETNH